MVRRPAAAIVLACGLLGAGTGVAGLALASQNGHPAATGPGRATVLPVPWPAGARTAAVAGRWPGQPGWSSRPSASVPGSSGSASAVRRPPGPQERRGGALVHRKLPAGAIGAAVIGGHIDSRLGPGVFYRLRLLRQGSRVYVRRADGTLAAFRVTAVRTYLKSRFPTEAVYGPAPDAQLRLITCGGTFDYATGHYLSNVIVYAALVH